jgi:hypothetical protein
MLERSRELLYALVAVVFISIVYLVMVALERDLPPARELYGHAMGIFGFLLMLMTETLYTARKNLKSARLGKMNSWLEFHIFTGIVGPYLVLLHSAWSFNGLAGLVMLLTGVIVFSGFIGRYIYSAIPRTAEGIELSLDELELRIADVENRIHLVGDLASADANLRALDKQRTRLRRQANGIVNARRLLALWHLVHVPIGLTLFALAVVHIVSAIYYASLLH